MGKDAPPAPDYSQLAAASAESAKYSYELGKEQLAWAKEQFASNKGTIDSVVDAALGRMDREEQNAIEDRERYETIFQPLEEQLAKEAEDYASPDRMEKEAGKAEAGVAQQMEQARKTAQEKLEGFGIDPSQTRAGALDMQSRIAEAAAQASAGNQARDKTEAIGRALRSEAINVGKGYPGQIAQTYGTAMQSGQQAGNSSLALTQSGASTMGTPGQWQQLGNQGTQMGADIMNKQFNNQLDSFKAGQSSSSGIGGALGFLGSFLPIPGFAEGGPADPAAGPPGTAIPRPPGAPSPHAGIQVPTEASPSRGGAPDDVNARLSAGEFVVPADVTKFKGEEFFQKLIMNARKQKMQAPAKPEVGNALPGPPQVDTASAPPSAIPTPGGA